MRRAHLAGVAVVAATAVGAAVAFVASCATTPPNIPVRTFERAQKTDVVCLDVSDPSSPPKPQPQSQCSPVPAGVAPSSMPTHLFAVVTQSTRGELAVVDLTAGGVIDEDQSTPGINFIPVGVNPTDVAVAPDGAMTFVSSADPDQLAIYGIDDTRLLGDYQGAARPLTLRDLAACALPQPPQSLTVTRAPTAAGYALVAVLRAWAGMAAQVVAIDPSGLLAEAGIAPDGGPPAPRQLAQCRVMGASVFASTLPPSWSAGPAWADGVPYTDPGDLRTTEPSLGSTCSGAGDDAGAEGGLPLSFGPLDAPRPTSVAIRDDQVHALYVGDDALPLVHVFDLSDPAHPREAQPLVAASAVDPTRRVSVGAIALSPPTRAFQRFLYAVDAKDGSLMVFDVTDPASPQRTPMMRPHPELNPFEPRDRIRFVAPVATLAFAQHDWPLLVPPPADGGAQDSHAHQAVLCNPNPNAHPDPVTFADLGAYYRADQVSVIASGSTVQGMPLRLRGVFAFATLSNGQVVAIDVDDWDAPCRRPDPMVDPGTAADAGVAAAVNGRTGVLDLPQPSAPAGDLEPYHAPIAYQKSIPESPAVSLESFFPVSAPHRPRSVSLLRNDPSAGQHAPNVVGVPQLFDASGSPVSVAGTGAVTKPLILPAPLPAGFYDPTYIANPTEPDPSARKATSDSLATASGVPMPAAGVLPGVRVSFDDPTAHIDQDWTITYEGALPTVSNVAAVVASSDGYKTLTFAAKGAGFCRRGIEDWRVGQARARDAVTAMGVAQMKGVPQDLPRWASDYVEITDDLLSQDDQYWGLDDDCWDGVPPDQRFNVCQQAYGAASDADTHLARDFPILEAYDDHLVVGRFGWTADTETTNGRVVVGSSASSAPFLQLARCCFHHQASFKVRTGGEWVTVGNNGIGLLHHVKADAATGACVPSCDPADVLRNARAFDVPRGTPSTDPKADCTSSPAPFDRNSPLAMRNPMFSFVMWGGCGTPAGPSDHTLTARDMAWKVSLKGGFQPLVVSITGNTTTAVSPQSMRFIDALGQIAVVDGESQGLVLIDLNTVAFAHAPYF